MIRKEREEKTLFTKVCQIISCPKLRVSFYKGRGKKEKGTKLKRATARTV